MHLSSLSSLTLSSAVFTEAKIASNLSSGDGFFISHQRVSVSPSLCRNPFNSNTFHYNKGFPSPSFKYGFYISPEMVPESLSVFRNSRKLHVVRCQRDFVEKRDDGFYMRRCVELARKGIGCTSPNPMVGCVIVKNGEIVGEGFHPKAGQPHAEVFALKDAGIKAENAIAYVSLEPCNHYGRTPPCTEALIRAKVKNVIVGMVDPNPIVASKGVERLRGAGIEVTVGVEEELCQKLNEAYIHRMHTGRPFVTLRYSLSFNGQTLNQVSKGAEESGGYHLQLLQEHDGVIISSTSLAGSTAFPVLHEKRANQPLLIIVAAVSDSPLCLPALTAEIASRAIVFAAKNTVIDPQTDSNLRRWGSEVVLLDQIDWGAIVDYCGHQGLCSVLVDLRWDFGAFHEIIDMGLEEGLVQKVVMEICPIWGGSDKGSVTGLTSLGRKSLRLKDLQSKILEGSVLVEGYLC